MARSFTTYGLFLFTEVVELVRVNTAISRKKPQVVALWWHKVDRGDLTKISPLNEASPVS